MSEESKQDPTAQRMKVGELIKRLENVCDISKVLQSLRTYKGDSALEESLHRSCTAANVLQFELCRTIAQYTDGSPVFYLPPISP